MPTNTPVPDAPVPGHRLPDTPNPPVRSPRIEQSGYLKLPDVLRLFPVSRTTWYGLIKIGAAPAPVKIGVGSFWQETDITAFLNRNPAELDAAMKRLHSARLPSVEEAS